MTSPLNLNGFHINIDSSDEEYLTIDVDCFTVVLKREVEGIVVDVYPLHAEGEPVATTYAVYSDLGEQAEQE